MKLLIITQKLDKRDSVLGFMHEWVAEFARQTDKVTVVCLEKGAYDLPANTRVFSLGKEKKHSRLRYIFNFYRFIVRERKNYTHVLVHMNSEYVVMGGFCWRFWGKRVGLWYAHGHVPFLLRAAEKLSDVIFTSTKSGFRLRSKKLNVIGQGIDTDLFKPTEQARDNKIFRIISVGRISPVKDYETLLQALKIISDKNIHADIIGGAGTPEQEKYFQSLRKIARGEGIEDCVDFAGPVANREIVGVLQSGDLFVNMSRTGSLDKAMLEAMACAVPILTCNEAMREVLGSYKDTLMYEKGGADRLAEKIKEFVSMNKSKREIIGRDLRQIVVRDHGLKQFVGKIISRLQKLPG